MDDLKEFIDKCEEKKTFTEDEKDELYYTYARNFLMASYDFKYVDKTFSDLFLNFSKQMLNNLSEKWQPTINNSQESDAVIIESKLDKLSKEEKEEILSEIENIENKLG